MPLPGFEPTIPASEQPQTHALDRAATEISTHCFFFGGGGAQQPPVDHGLLIHELSRSHTTTHHIRLDSSRRMISSSQRPLPDNTHKTHDIYVPGGILTYNLGRRATADLRLRPRGHWDRRIGHYTRKKIFVIARCDLSLVASHEAAIG
jgi:hypothetical protein